MDTGTCRFCGKEFKKNSISRHIAACTVLKQEASDRDTIEYQHLRIEDSWTKEYWMNVLIAPGTRLLDLDLFLQKVWLDCCG